MSIKLRVPPNLFMLTGYQKIVETTGQNVGECIDDLDSQFPGAKRMLCDKQGQLLNYYEVYVNSEKVHSDKLTKPVKDGDEVKIVIFLAGG